MGGQRYDLLTSGYVSMDRMVKIKTPAKVGFTSLIENKSCAKIYYGGCSVNVAYALCKLGLQAMPLIRVGDDYKQTGFQDFLAGAGVPTDGVRRVSGETTSVCYLVQDQNGEHITLFYPGAMDKAYAAPWEDDYFKQARMGLITVGSRPDNQAFLEGCKKFALPLAFGMKGDMDAFPVDFLRELLHYCQVIFTNQSEREAIEQMLSANLDDLLLQGSAKVIVTTLGKRGSRFCYLEDGVLKAGEVPICSGGPMVDATGSGDAYISGFLYGYLQNLSYRECAGLGTVLASFVIEKEGCCTGAPTLQQLRQRLDDFTF